MLDLDAGRANLITEADPIDKYSNDICRGVARVVQFSGASAIEQIC